MSARGRLDLLLDDGFSLEGDTSGEASGVCRRGNIGRTAVAAS